MSCATRCAPASPASCMSASTCCRLPAPTCASMARTSIRLRWSRRWRPSPASTAAAPKSQAMASTAWSITSSGRSAPQPGCRSAGRRRRPSCRPTSATRPPNLFREVNRQRHFLRDWLRRNHLYAIARHAIAARREAAFAEAGLAVDGAARLQRADRGGGGRDQAAQGRDHPAHPQAGARRARHRQAAEAGRAHPGHRRAGHRQEQDLRRDHRQIARRRSLDLVARAEPGEGRRAGRASTTACAPPTASWRASCAAVARSIRAPTMPTPCVPGIRW